MLGNVQISSSEVNVIVGCILTFMGLAIIGFISFFLVRLIRQLDQNTLSLIKISELLAVLESRVTNLEHKAISVTTEEDVDKHSHKPEGS